MCCHDHCVYVNDSSKGPASLWDQAEKNETCNITEMWNIRYGVIGIWIYWNFNIDLKKKKLFFYYFR